MEQEKIEVTEEVKEIKETKMRDEETLEKLNPKKKPKSKIRYFQTTFFVPYLTAATPTTWM